MSLLPTEERGFKIAVELDVTLPQVQDPEQAVRIVGSPPGVPVLERHDGETSRSSSRRTVHERRSLTESYSPGRPQSKIRCLPLPEIDDSVNGVADDCMLTDQPALFRQEQR